MTPIQSDHCKGAKSAFADFIRYAKSKQKKRVYREVLAEAIRRQNLVLTETEAKRNQLPILMNAPINA
ncbi:hypothetical protein [Pseudomonas sp. G(2018)]|uniref:hypothetical protein n=1 Tax=Pseudomonas sp. G(2018) TaxID=2502242 RepID=UPI0010F56AC0|nr:hypothetical protein [Pseudomonas sp. G(2018)]